MLRGSKGDFFGSSPLWGKDSGTILIFCFPVCISRGPLLISLGIFYLAARLSASSLLLATTSIGPFKERAAAAEKKGKRKGPKRSKSFFCARACGMGCVGGGGGSHTDFLLGTGEGERKGAPPHFYSKSFPLYLVFCCFSLGCFCFFFFCPSISVQTLLHQKKGGGSLGGGKGPLFFLEPRCPIDSKHGTRKKSVSPFCFCGKIAVLQKNEG